MRLDSRALQNSDSSPMGQKPNAIAPITSRKQLPGRRSGLRRQRRATVILLVLILVPVLSLGGYSFTHQTRAEAEGARSRLHALHAHRCAESGIERVIALLANPDLFSDPSVQLDDDPTNFAQQMIFQRDDGFSGYVSIVAPQITTDDGTPRFGLLSESSKIPLHHPQLLPSRESLLMLPNMTEEIADALIDWLDADDEPEELGAESEFYSGLNPPYLPRNGAPRTLAELLLVKGMTPELLYGEDVNFNGLLDPNEDDGDQTWPPDNADGALDLGWQAFLTVTSASDNLDSTGLPKLNLNDGDTQTLHATLTELFDEKVADFIVMYREVQKIKGKSGIGSISELIDAKIDAKDAQQLSGTGNGDFDFNDLVNSAVSLLTAGNNGQMPPIESPWTSQNMGEFVEIAYDLLSTTSETRRVGTIDVTRAPMEVLMTLPEMEAELAQQIVDQATAHIGDPTLAWMLLEGVVAVEKFRDWEPYLAAHSRVFQLQAIGTVMPAADIQQAPVARLQVIIDASVQPPAILQRWDLSRQSSGYPRELLVPQIK